MNDRLIHSGSIAAAAVVIGGFLTLAMPQHTANIIRLVVITVGAAAALHALVTNVPEWTGVEWLTSPFNRSRGSGKPHPASEEIDRIRGKLSRRRQPMEDGPPLSPETLRMLQPLIVVALERKGLTPRDRSRMDAARGLVSPLTWTVLMTPPLKRRSWYATRRPNEWDAAEVVHRVLDDLDRLAADTESARPLPSPTRGAA